MLVFIIFTSVYRGFPTASHGTRMVPRCISFSLCYRDLVMVFKLIGSFLLIAVLAVDQYHGECTAVSIIYKFSMPHGCCSQGLRSLDNLLSFSQLYRGIYKLLLLLK